MIDSIPTLDTYDAVVIGARCAGASTAMLLARAGLDVLAVDRDARGSDALSTHALMRAGVLQLERWGLGDAVRALGAPPIRRTRFYYGDDLVEVPIKARHGVDALYAPRRDVFDALLVAAAERSGAEVHHRCSMLDASFARGRVTGVTLRSASGRVRHVRTRLLIGADGVRSRVARVVRAPVEQSAQHAAGCLYGYVSGLSEDAYEWHYRPGVGAGVIPTSGHRACVFASTTPERLSRELEGGARSAFRNVVAEAAPALARRIDGSEHVSAIKGFSGVRGYMRQAAGSGWALVGDAGYFKDPATAHGMTDALRDAELLARAAATGTDRALVEYGAIRNELSSTLSRVTEAIASYRWDLESVRPLHVDLSKEMARETAFLAALDLPVPSSRRRIDPDSRVPESGVSQTHPL